MAKKRSKAKAEEDDPFAFLAEPEKPMPHETLKEEARDPVTKILRGTCLRARRLSWPEDVPILTADDLVAFSTHTRKRGEGRDISDWVAEVFPWMNEDKNIRSIGRIFHNEISLLRMEVGGFPDRGWVHFCNNHTLAEQAKLWNDALRRCGYDIPLAEERKKRKKKHGRDRSEGES